MPQYACLRCSRLSPAKVCETCQPNERPRNAPWSRGRKRSTQQKFRDRLMAEYGGQCGAVLDNGTRCPRTQDLQAHHTHGLDDPRGILLCQPHHRQVDRYAR